MPSSTVSSSARVLTPSLPHRCVCCSASASASLARRCLRSGSSESQCASTMGSRHSSLSNSNNQPVTTNGHLLRPRTTTLDDSCTKRPLEVQCNGIINNHNHLTRLSVKSDSFLGKELGLEYEGLSRRTRTISASCPGTNNELSQLSPTGSDITHHLRSRKQMWLPTSLLGTTAEDALNSTRLRMSRDYPLLEGMKSAQVKGSLKSPTMSVSDEKSKSNGKDEDEKCQSKQSFHECNNIDKGKGHELWSEEEEEDSRQSHTMKAKAEDEKGMGKRKLKKKSVPRELANLSYNDEKRRKVLKKRLSVEEKLIEDNKTYYKVEVLNSKLRSTGYYLSQSQRELEMSKTNGNEGCVTQNCSEPLKNDIKSEEKEPVVVRFKKVRQTELSLLSDEAESFMFGEPSRRESSVSTESSEEDDEVSVKLESDDHDKTNIKIKKEVVDESSMGSCSLASSSTSSRRKRKSPDESIIRDNVEYYKFEATGSRLRFHGNLFPPALDQKDIKTESPYGLRSDSKGLVRVKLDENDFEPENVINEEKLCQEKNKPCKNLYEELEFSFEKAPVHEPWYQTFKRQDECREFYYPSYTNYPRVLLPYEYPSYLMKRIRVAAVVEKSKRKKRKMKQPLKLKQLVVDDRPRKSPRCHASTLAIMSSLTRRRPRDSPDKKSDVPYSEVPMVSNDIIQDEESRCSTIIDPPSVTPSDSIASFQPPVHRIPEIKVDARADLAAQTKTTEELKVAERVIEDLFTDMCYENNDDLLAQMLDAVRKEIETSPGKDNTKKGKSKVKCTKREPVVHLDEAVTCLPVDPQILDEEQPNTILSSGPIVDVLSLIEGYRSCSSMERADYEHMNPHASDALRVLIADSCNSSEYGGSSACDYSFLEDGKMSKRRKKKKRNLTGWPVNHKRKFMKKNEELSTVVLRRNCRARDGVKKDSELDALNEQGEKVVDSEVVVKLKEEHNGLLTVLNDESVDSDVRADSVKSDLKVCSTISRTTSVDSSSIKSFDNVQSCYIKVKKMPDGCIESLSRCLRSSESVSSRRASSRKAKLAGRESLRRCSSKCGGSPACDDSLLEDEKVCKKRKRKKRNLTGWPVNYKKKYLYSTHKNTDHKLKNLKHNSLKRLLET